MPDSIPPPNTPRKPGISGKRFALGFVLTLASILGALLYYFTTGRTLEGEILAEVPIEGTDGERIVVRRGMDQHRGIFMVRVNAADEEVWSDRRVLYGFQRGTVPALTSELVSVRTRRSSGLHETHAFRLEDAEFVWAGATPEPPFDADGGPGPSFAFEGVLTEVYRGDPGEVIGVRAEDGVEVYRFPLAIGADEPVRLEGGLVRVGDARCFVQRSGESTDCPG